MNRRGALKIIAAPWVITTAGLLMPVKKVWVPEIEDQTWFPASGVAGEYRMTPEPGGFAKIDGEVLHIRMSAGFRNGAAWSLREFSRDGKVWHRDSVDLDEVVRILGSSIVALPFKNGA